MQDKQINNKKQIVKFYIYPSESEFMSVKTTLKWFWKLKGVGVEYTHNKMFHIYIYSYKL